MKCGDFEGLLSPSLDGALSAAEAQRLLAHLQECKACGRRAQRLRTARDIFRAARPESARPRPPSMRRRYSPVPAAAAALTISLSLLLITLVDSPSARPEPLVDRASELLIEVSTDDMQPPCYRPADCGLAAPMAVP